MKTENIKNNFIRNGWEENEVGNALNSINDNKNNNAKASFLQIFLNNKNFFSKKTLVLLILFFILLVSSSFLAIKFISKTISQPFKSSFSRGEIFQRFERKPTKKALTQEIFVKISGKTQIQRGIYKGYFEDGMSFILKDKDKEEFEKRFKQIHEGSEQSTSLFTIEARDINNQVLLEIPVATVGKIAPGGDFYIPSYRDPGFFDHEIILPVNTNSIVLRKRFGDILDRVYVEEWQPEVKFLSYPKNVKSTDKFQVELELHPLGKAYNYSLYLNNVRDGSRIGPINGSLQPKSGKIIENIDLKQYPFTTTDSWVLEAVGYSLFNLKNTLSEPITITLSAENIEVKISGKDKTIRRSGESDSIGWSHIFYDIDVTQGLKELCKKGRCFELIWSGEGVQFNENRWELKPVDTIKTQIRTLDCNFRGSGKQTIHLKVEENGKVIGEDTYTYTVSGIGSEKSICRISE